MSTSNQALSFINAVAGIKNINVTIDNAIKAIYTRTGKTASASGKGGLSYVNEVLTHKAIDKGTSQNAKAVKALMAHIHALGLTVGMALNNGETFTSDVIQASQQAVNTFFTDTLATIKASADKSRAEAKAKKESEKAQTVEGADDDNGLTLDVSKPLVFGADDVLVIDDNTYIDIAGEAVLFSVLVTAYQAHKTTLIKELLNAPTVKPTKQKAVA